MNPGVPQPTAIHHEENRQVVSGLGNMQMLVSQTPSGSLQCLQLKGLGFIKSRLSLHLQQSTERVERSQSRRVVFTKKPFLDLYGTSSHRFAFGKVLAPPQDRCQCRQGSAKRSLVFRGQCFQLSHSSLDISHHTGQLHILNGIDSPGVVVPVGGTKGKSRLAPLGCLVEVPKKEARVGQPHVDPVVTGTPFDQRLEGRPVQRGQSLLVVADVTGPWVAELAIPDDRAIISATTDGLLTTATLAEASTACSGPLARAYAATRRIVDAAGKSSPIDIQAGLSSVQMWAQSDGSLGSSSVFKVMSISPGRLSFS